MLVLVAFRTSTSLFTTSASPFTISARSLRTLYEVVNVPENVLFRGIPPLFCKFGLDHEVFGRNLSPADDNHMPRNAAILVLRTAILVLRTAILVLRTVNGPDEVVILVLRTANGPKSGTERVVVVATHLKVLY